MSVNAGPTHDISELLDGLQNFRCDEKYCDFVVECENAKFPVHRAVLRSRSAHLDRFCGGMFLEQGEGTIKIQGENPQNVRRMLDYLYSLEYKVEATFEDKAQDGGSDFVDFVTQLEAEQSFNHGFVHAQMYAIGDKYLINALKAYAPDRFQKAITVQTGANLATSISEAYLTTPETDRGLRDVILTSTIDRVIELAYDTTFSQVAIDVPCFGYELLQRTLMRVLSRNGRSWRVQGCMHCPRNIDNPLLYNNKLMRILFFDDGRNEGSLRHYVRLQ